MVDERLLTPEERKQIPEGFHFLLEYKEELDWLLELQLAKADKSHQEELYNRTMEAKKSGWDDCLKFYTDKAPDREKILEIVRYVRNECRTRAIPHGMEEWMKRI